MIHWQNCLHTRGTFL